MITEQITFTAVDGVTIAGDYYAGSSERSALLLHMMPATKESWRDFAVFLQTKGYNVLAIDLRGHGRSAGGPEGYQNFTEAEHRESIRDVEAGMLFLRSKELGPEHTVLVGASIGANLALWYLADHSEARQAVFLSPGLNYRGVETEPLAKRLRRGQRVFFVASEDDERQSGRPAQMSQILYDNIPDGIEKKILLYKKAGHGTDMFGKEKPDLAVEIAAWIQ